MDSWCETNKDFVPHACLACTFSTAVQSREVGTKGALVTAPMVEVTFKQLLLSYCGNYWDSAFKVEGAGLSS